MALKIIGVLLILFSTTMLPPLFIGLVASDRTAAAFATGFATTLFSGVVIWLLTRLSKGELSIRDGFVVTALFWLVLGLFGAIPFWLSPQLALSPTEAIFESISGLTTTGATVITGLDELPRSLLFYRQFLQWLGGIGIILLAVAILPMLGIGGMQLYRAESAGPSKDRKLTPLNWYRKSAICNLFATHDRLCVVLFCGRNARVRRFMSRFLNSGYWRLFNSRCEFGLLQRK